MSVLALQHPTTITLPHQRMERWKFTPFNRAVDRLDVSTAPSALHIDAPQSPYVRVQKTLPDWAIRAIKPEVTPDDLALWATNNQSIPSVVMVDVPADKIADVPVSLLMSRADSGQAMGRICIRVGRGAKLTIIENHAAPGACFKNLVTQIVLEENASLTHVRMLQDSSQTVLGSTTHLIQQAGSSYMAYALMCGGAMTRNQIFVDLMGANASCTLAGAHLLAGQQHGDTTILIEHQAPHCYSNQNYKTVLAGQSHGVFQGKVHVHQVAQKTDGYQLSNAILLSPLAVMDTKPELEIYADDVKCSHGATTGQMDDEPLFYLKSRGIPESEARALLLKAFVMASVESLPSSDLQALIESQVDRWLKEAL